jgi:protein-disulfide isomerase
MFTKANTPARNFFATATAATMLACSTLSVYAGGWFSATNESAANTLTTEQVKQVLQQHPEIVYDALVAYQKKQADNKKKEVQTYLHSNARKLFYSKNDGVLGNPAGKTSILIINDYRCGFCSKARTVIDEIVKANGDVRIVVKQLPILGPDSMYAAKAATYAQQKNKFASFDNNLTSQEKPLTKEKVNMALKQSGLKEADLNAQNDSVDVVIQENYKHATGLAVQGTPVVIIANSNLTKVEIIDNVLDQKAFEAKVKEYQS